jgi:hypothetical protein
MSKFASLSMSSCWTSYFFSRHLARLISLHYSHHRNILFYTRMNFVFDDMTIKLEKTFVAISGRGYHKPQAEAVISKFLRI